MTLLSLFLFGCSNGWEARCNKTLTNLCALRVECGVEATFIECIEGLEEQYVCDDSVIEQAFDPCLFRLDQYMEATPPVCYDAMPAECSDVLCSKEFGCDFVTSQETGNEVVPTGSGQSAGGSGFTLGGSGNR
jgi:hypothetical protein